jgi:acetoin utilization deacetylase AcuC-like enzyme
VAVSFPVTWSDAHRLHAPESAVWVGARIDADELPERADLIRAALEEAGALVVEAVPHPDEALLAVHDAGLVDFLRTAWEHWQAGGMPDAAGTDDVVGYIYPTAGLLGGLDPHVPTALSARTGSWAFDTMTPVGAGTWKAARAAVDVALTAADLVLDGAPAAYACCRPPGHHVTRSGYGGSCYLNNAAVAAQYLRDRGKCRVAIVDLDAHHGNGAQAIFWERDDVLTASVHVDPGAGWFPHFLGFEDESGHANANIPLPPGSGDAIWLAAVDRLAATVEEHGCEALVVALGVDAAAGDPNSPLAVTQGGYREAGRLLGALGRPTVLVQEGGYVLETIGPLVRTTLEGFESAR